MTIMYDKTGALFELDHEHNGTAYVRPMVRYVFQGEDLDEHEDFEPAHYLVAMDQAELFSSPPVASINRDIAVKKNELEALKSEMAKIVREADQAKRDAERKLSAAQRQLDEWMKKHKGMVDLGKLLDGKVLYPLRVKENPYHHGRDVPTIPKMKDIRGLYLQGGDFERGQEWTAKKYMSDIYELPFQFFDTEQERAAMIRSEFEVTCQAFRKNPQFDTTSHTSITKLHYGTLMDWVKSHPELAIPEDIEAAKAENDAELARQRKAELAAELAAMEA